MTQVIPNPVALVRKPLSTSELAYQVEQTYFSAATPSRDIVRPGSGVYLQLRLLQQKDMKHLFNMGLDQFLSDLD